MNILKSSTPYMKVRVIFEGTPMSLMDVAKLLESPYSKVYYLWNNRNRPLVIKNRNILLPKDPPIPIEIVGLGKFPSVSAAAKAMNVRKSSMQSKVKRYGTVLTLKQATPRKKKPVPTVLTITFSSITSAARLIGVSRSVLARRVKRKGTVLTIAEATNTQTQFIRKKRTKGSSHSLEWDSFSDKDRSNRLALIP